MKGQTDVRAVLVAMLGKVPGVVVKRKLNSSNFAVKKKVFAFTKGDGMVLKLPPKTVKKLIQAKAATMLVMGKRTMKEWVVIPLKDPAVARKHLTLLKEAKRFVSSKA